MVCAKSEAPAQDHEFGGGGGGGGGGGVSSSRSRREQHESAGDGRAVGAIERAIHQAAEQGLTFAPPKSRVRPIRLIESLPKA